MDTNIKTIKVALAAVLWTTTVAFAVAGSVNRDTWLMLWAILVALVACVVTTHMVTETAVKNDRVHIERMIDGLISGADDKDDVGRIH